MRIDKQALVKRQISALEPLGLEELRAKFVELYGFQSHIISADYMRRRCAYRLQELQFGGLSREAEEFLDRLVDEDDLAQLKPQKARRQSSVKGTRYIREWNGQEHVVVVLGANSFEYNGTVYKSLSAIAKAITGTHWNGPRFFGVER